MVAVPPTRTVRILPVVVAGVLLLVATVTFVVIDPLLAWDDANPFLGRGRLLLYFTSQSNLLAVSACVVFGVALLRGRNPGRAAEYLRGLAAVDMAITGIVANVLLAEPDAPWSFSDFVLHQAMPVLMVVWWIAAPPAQPLPVTAVALWLAHPVIWTAMTLTYAAESSDRWYPYFFLDPAQVGGWGGVAAFVAMIHLVIGILGLGAVLASRAQWSDAVGKRWDAKSPRATTR
ncbi:Pr6Pr family membrane protein [Microbispora sp. RL4-1S]|uniref:Pr6Pr family membrane protein n=1 Tax=Microbispora oryzae TaxID=2806554 RepID=A0A941AN62_9ACTN|nr:Pr6Pr family membrane protein [Microbispora oryzae]MBP2707998.1 Pr6Pr family membrane protein [Microbispora oryzae]